MSEPRVSILMSVYNGEKHLPEAIESIVHQTYDDFEFLVIDDASSDRSAEIIASYSDPRIRVLRNEHNLGLTRSLNALIGASRGELVARMDADDVSSPLRIELQVKEFDANPGLDIVGSYFEIIDRGGIVVRSVVMETDPIHRLWRLQFHNRYAHGGIMIRKAALVAAGLYDEDFRTAQDYDLWSRLATPKNTCVIPRFLYRWRQIHGGVQVSSERLALQVANAVNISNLNLLTCNPCLDLKACSDVRPLYWKYEKTLMSIDCVGQILCLVQSFSRRFDLSQGEELRLRQTVIADLIGYVLAYRRVPFVDRIRLGVQLVRKLNSPVLRNVLRRIWKSLAISRRSLFAANWRPD